MLKMKIVIITFCLFISSGCAPKKPISYNPKNSKALNIVTAAGMNYGLKDVSVPQDTVTDIRDSKTFGAAYGVASYYSPSPGLSSSGSAGLAILSWALLPKTPAARNSIIAWMPESIGGISQNEAFNKMADIIIEATEKAAKDLNYSPSVIISKKGKKGFGVRLTNDKSDNCKSLPNNKPSSCIVVYKVRDPQKTDNTASFVGKGTSWFFSPIENAYTAPVFINKNKFDYNQVDLMIAVSRHLPDWAYIYLAPNEVNISEKEKLKMPLILNKGQVHLFIKKNNS